MTDPGIRAASDSVCETGGDQETESPCDVRERCTPSACYESTPTRVTGVVCQETMPGLDPDRSVKRRPIRVIFSFEPRRIVGQKLRMSFLTLAILSTISRQQNVGVIWVLRCPSPSDPSFG